MDRLTDFARESLLVARSSFLQGEMSESELRAYLKYNLGFSSESAEEYLQGLGEVAPQGAASPNAQLAPPEPVERRRPLLRPRYG